MAVKPGDPILKHLTAAWYNEVTKSASPQRLTGGGNVLDKFDRLIITVRKNEIGISYKKYDAIQIAAPYIDYEKPFDISHESIVFNTYDPDVEPGLHDWVVLLEPLPVEANKTAKAVLLGTTWVRQYTANLNSYEGQSLVYRPSLSLTYGFEGKATILHRVIVGDFTYLLITLGNVPLQRERFFELTGNMEAIDYPMVSDELPNTRITAKAPANFYNFDGQLAYEDTLYSWDGIIDDKGTGFKGTAVLMNNHWLFDQANCNQADMIISS